MRQIGSNVRNVKVPKADIMSFESILSS